MLTWFERWQVPLYLAALGFGVALGLCFVPFAPAAAAAANPVLGLLLYVTFLGVPFRQMVQSVRDWRFLGAVTVLNFVLVPGFVWVLTRAVAHDRVLLAGVLFVLLAPCVDYVIVFTGIAGGAKERLLAAAPLLMLGQMLLLPVYLWWFLGAEFVRVLDPAPFIAALLGLIVLPLGIAVLTQLVAAHNSWAAGGQRCLSAAMVPLMMLTLVFVVASQIASVRDALGSLLLTVPIFICFVAVMVPLGLFTGRIAQLNVPGQRALVFSGATRNSLVVLPLVLALPAGFELAPMVVVTQTLVELVMMVVLVRAVPRLVRRDPGPSNCGQPPK